MPKRKTPTSKSDIKLALMRDAKVVGDAYDDILNMETYTPNVDDPMFEVAAAMPADGLSFRHDLFVLLGKLAQVHSNIKDELERRAK